MVKVRLVLRDDAMGLGRYPSFSAAFETRCATSGVTIPTVSGLSARETVDACTPARSATSRNVTLLLLGALSVNPNLGNSSSE